MFSARLHIQLGATGDHVAEIQVALELVDDSNIEKAELAANKLRRINHTGSAGLQEETQNH